MTNPRENKRSVKVKFLWFFFSRLRRRNSVENQLVIVWVTMCVPNKGMPPTNWRDCIEIKTEHLREYNLMKFIIHFSLMILYEEKYDSSNWMHPIRSKLDHGWLKWIHYRNFLSFLSLWLKPKSSNCNQMQRN